MATSAARVLPPRSSGAGAESRGEPAGTFPMPAGFRASVLVELLGGGAVAVPDLQPGAVGRSAAGGVQAATRLRVLQRSVGLGDPVLGAGAVAVPQLDLDAVGGATADHVQAAPERLQRL